MLPRLFALLFLSCLAIGCAASPALAPPYPSPIVTVPATRLVPTVEPTPTLHAGVPVPSLTSGDSPVTGSLVIQNGMCCAGGQVGSTIKITVEFSASSPKAAVTEMRTLSHCGGEPEMAAVEWEPYLTHREYSYRIAIANWIGWYIAVQYKDASGNVSPIYCDDISVEGMPAQP